MDLCARGIGRNGELGDRIGGGRQPMTVSLSPSTVAEIPMSLGSFKGQRTSIRALGQPISAARETATSSLPNTIPQGALFGPNPSVEQAVTRAPPFKSTAAATPMSQEISRERQILIRALERPLSPAPETATSSLPNTIARGALFGSNHSGERALIRVRPSRSTAVAIPM